MDRRTSLARVVKVDGTIRGASEDLQRGVVSGCIIMDDCTYILAKSGAESHAMDMTCNVVSGERTCAMEIIIKLPLWPVSLVTARLGKFITFSREWLAEF